MTDINNKEDDFGSLGDFVTDDADSAENTFGSSDDDDDGFNPADFAGADDDDDMPEVEGIAGPGETGFGGDAFGAADDDDFDEDGDSDFSDPFAVSQDDDDAADEDFGASDPFGEKDPFEEEDEAPLSAEGADFGEDDDFPGLDETGQNDDGDFDPEDDDFEAAALDADNDNPAEDEAPQKSLLSKLIVPIGGVVAASVVAIVGYTQVLPMFSGGSQPAAVTPPPVASNTQGFPTQLPSLGSAPTPSAPSEQALPALAQPLAPSTTGLPDFSAPAAPTAPPPVAIGAPTTAPLLAPQAPAVLPNSPVVPAVAAVTAPATTALPTATPVVAAAPALGDVDIDRLNQVLEIDFDATTSKVNRLQVQVAGLENTILGLERKIDDLSEMVAAPSMAVAGISVPVAPVIDAIQPKLKPEVIQGIRLTGYSPKSAKAWIKLDPELIGPDGDPSGRMVVAKGDDIPGAGKFVTVRRYNGRSIMVTSNGFVME